MAESQDLDRSEAATPFKLEKARERGQTPRSVDLVSAVVFLAAMLYLAGQGLDMAQAMLQLSQATLVHAGRVDTVAALWPLVTRLLSDPLLALLPLLLLLPLAAILGAVAQTGMVFSIDALQLDFERISPAAGLRRLFSMRTIFEGVRACLKLLVLVAVAVVALQALQSQFHTISAMPPAVFLRTMAQDATGLGLKMALALLVISGADVAFTRYQFGKTMRMSRRELKDEHKNREGDPRIRSRLRELRRELLQRSRSLRNTRDADVVLTNPTHYAVALRYVHGEMDAPRVVAKGAGQLAAAMREIAARHQLVVVQNPPLTRRLFRESRVEESIPVGAHADVARIFVWVFTQRRQRERGMEAPA